MSLLDFQYDNDDDGDNQGDGCPSRQMAGARGSATMAQGQWPSGWEWSRVSIAKAKKSPWNLVVSTVTGVS